MKQNKILIVDDNERNTAIVRKILRNDYELVDACSGEEALEIVGWYRPDIVLLDIMLPGIDGYEVCRQLKGNAQLPNTKIIMVTAKAMIGEKLNGYEAGADDYVTKPFDGEELLAKVAVYLRLKTVEEHEALKSGLLTLLGHETRTPLTYVMAATENLMAMGELSKQESELAKIIHDGTSRIADVLAKVLRYGELTSNSVIESKGPCDVASVIDIVTARLAEKASAKNITVTRDGRETPYVAADAMHVTETLEIILDNAIGFSPADGVVSVETTEENDEIRISVRDNGPGIPEDLLPRLFEGLHTTDVAHHSKGHGLNLAIARALVEAPGGRLVVSSEAERETTFTICLPIAKEAPPVKTWR